MPPEWVYRLTVTPFRVRWPLDPGTVGDMTDARGANGGRRLSGVTPGPSAVEVRVAAQLENLAVLRTLVGAVGTFSDLDVDAVADLRLAVDEACTRLIRSATANAVLVVVVDPRDDAVVVEASTECSGDDVLGREASVGTCCVRSPTRWRPSAHLMARPARNRGCSASP